MIVNKRVNYVYNIIFFYIMLKKLLVLALGKINARFKIEREMIAYRGKCYLEWLLLNMKVVIIAYKTLTSSHPRVTPKKTLNC